MTTQEFRESPELVSEMRKILEHPVLAMWLEAMESENPANFRVADDVTPHFAHIMLGQQTGYGVCKRTFLEGGKPFGDLPTDLKQDYSKSREEIEAETDEK